MSHVSKVLLFVILLFLLTGCSLPFIKDANSQDSTELESKPKFTVEQVILSQGFQNTDSRIDLSRKNNQLQLMVSPGLIKSTGIKVSKIEEKDGVYNIHIVNSSYSSAELVIPQITILLSEVTHSQAESMKFNIVNENYTPITISYGIVDILNKINSDFKISTDRYPSIKLVEENNEPLWIINFYSIYDMGNIEIPVINLNIKINANSGEVIESSKGLISTLHDFGTILDFVPGKGFLYSHRDMITSNNVLFLYDFESNEKKELYRSYSNIETAHLSPDGSHVALLEKNSETTVAFIVSISDGKAIRIDSQQIMVPEKLLWINNDDIQILNKFSDQQTAILVYNINDNNWKTSRNMVMDLCTFETIKDIVLTSQYIEGEMNNRILLEKGASGLKFIDDGFCPKILNENLGMYLQNIDNSTKKALKIFDFNTLDTIYQSDFNVSAARQISSDTIIIIEKLPGNSNFDIHLLYIENMELSHLGVANSSSIYFDQESKRVYANPNITYKEELTEIIYSVDLSDLKRR